MKDYTLSEIQKICKNRVEHIKNPCKECEMRINHICNNTLPIGWQIDKRDIADLPCKIVYSLPYSGIKRALVVYQEEGKIGFQDDFTEAEADAFIAELKGGKQ